jgi:hypothetical protein
LHYTRKLSVARKLHWLPDHCAASGGGPLAPAADATNRILALGEAKMDELKMIAAVAKRLGIVTTADTLGSITAALRAAKEAVGQ